MRKEEFQNLETDKKLEEIYKSTEKTRKYIKWTLIISIAVILLPLLLFPFAISKFIGIYDFSEFGL